MRIGGVYEPHLKKKSLSMNDNTVFSALEVLKKAALLVLYEEYRYGQRGFLRLKELREQLGIPPIEKARDKNSLAHGILIQLWGDEYAQHTPRDQ